MSVGGMRRGPELPYKLLAGVVPCPGGWLLASAKLVGTTMHAESPEVVPTLRDVLDHIPGFTIIGLGAPIGLPDDPAIGGRKCDREARQLLQLPRRGAILAAPCGAVLDAPNYREARERNGGHLDIITWRLMSRIREVREEVQPYRQRTVYEVCPELSLHQLNDNHPMTSRKRSAAGQEERRLLLVQRFPGSERILDAETIGASAYHRTDACAALWTARRLVARAVIRLPQDPEWSSQGLRMEIVR
jgi:predicted RNase H-like nuclease